jgi:uncharacterized protein YcgI (DUF1989 family)
MSTGSNPEVFADVASNSEVHRIPAGTGRAFRLFAGQIVKLMSPEGPQVADTWAFKQADMAEFLSTEHTRSCLDRLTPRIGDAFFSNRRNPMLTIVRDTTPGCHDLLLSACDIGRYTLLGHQGYHANCVDNFKSGLPDQHIRKCFDWCGRWASYRTTAGRSGPVYRTSSRNGSGLGRLGLPDGHCIDEWFRSAA